MKMTTDVLLVHPPPVFDPSSKPMMYSKTIGYGMLHVATALTRKGYDAVVWNLEESISSGVNLKEIARTFRRLNPKVVGIELNWLHQSKGALETAEFIKGLDLSAPIIIGGTHATLFAKDIVHKYHKIVDAVLKGEAELTFTTLVENIEKTGQMGKVGGLVTLVEGHRNEHPRSKDDLVKNIDDLALVSYRTVRPEVKDKDEVSINTCRGPCKFNCIHCADNVISLLSGRQSYVAHSPKWIIDQINLLIEEGFREFSIQDSLYVSGNKHLRETAKALQKEYGQRELSLSMIAVPGVLDRSTLRDLSRAGLERIHYGVESGSDKILSLLRRPTLTKEILQAMEITISEGIIPLTWWMVGLPGESKTDVEETIKLTKRTMELGAIPTWVTPLIVFPGTVLYNQASEYRVKPLMKSFEDFAVFSELQFKPGAWYPQAISHETEYMSRTDILKASFDLRAAIYLQKERIVDNYKRKHLKTLQQYHSDCSESYIERIVNDCITWVLASFF